MARNQSIINIYIIFLTLIEIISLTNTSFEGNNRGCCVSTQEQIPNTQTRSPSRFVNKFRARGPGPTFSSHCLSRLEILRNVVVTNDANCRQDRLEATNPSPDSRNYRETEGRMNRRYSGGSSGGIGTLRGRDKADGSRGNLCGQLGAINRVIPHFFTFPSFLLFFFSIPVVF